MRPGDVLVVRLVEHHHARSGTASSRATSSSWRDGRAGGVVGRGHQHQAGALGDGLGRCAAMSRVSKRSGHGDRRRRRRWRCRSGRLSKRAPGVEHLARRGRRTSAGAAAAARPSRSRPRRASGVSPSRSASASRTAGGPVVGVAVGAPSAASVDGVAHRRQRVERVLVAGQLDGRVEGVLVHGHLGRPCRACRRAGRPAPVAGRERCAMRHRLPVATDDARASEVAAAILVALDGFEQRLEVALAEALGARAAR